MGNVSRKQHRQLDIKIKKVGYIKFYKKVYIVNFYIKFTMKQENVYHHQQSAWNTLIDAISKRDYKLWESLGELIDNSLSNRFLNPKTNELEPVTVNITINPNEIKVRDNGMGQDAKGLGASIDYGKPNKKVNSRFGVGLKQSAPGLGDRVILSSKMYGEKGYNKLELNIDEIRKNPKKLSESVIPVYTGIEGHEEDEHFFEVRIRKLRISVDKRSIKRLRENLPNYFSNFINSGALKVYINETELKPIPKSTLVYKEEFIFKEMGISGYWGVMKKRTSGSSRNQGACSFYNGRLITQSDTDLLGIETRHPDWNRLDCEIYFDDESIFKDNIASSKNNWTKDKNYYKVSELLYSKVALPYYEKLKELNLLEKKEKKVLELDACNEILPKMLRDIFPNLRQPRAVTTKERALAGEEPDGEDEFDIEQRDGTSNNSPTGSEPVEYDNKRKPTKTHKKRRAYTLHHVFIDDIRYEIRVSPNWNWEPYVGRYVYTLDKEEKELIIELNMNHPFLNEYITSEVLPVFILEWAIEVVLQALGITEVREFIEQREEHVLKINYDEKLKEIETFVSMLRVEETMKK